MYYFVVVFAIVVGLLYAGRYLDYLNVNPSYLYIMALFFAFVLGFRGTGVGIDTINYYNYFEIVKRASWHTLFSSGLEYSSLEIGYCLLMKLCSFFSDSYYFFQFVQSLLYSFLIIRFIREESNNYILAIICVLGLDMFLLPMNIARQMLAISLVANGWVELTNNKILKAFIIILIAGLIHNIELIFLIAFVLYHFRNNKWMLRLAPLAAILIGINYNSILDFAREYIPRYHNYYGNWRGVHDAGYVQLVWVVLSVISFLLIIKFTPNLRSNHQEGEDLTVTNKDAQLIVISGIFSIVYVIFQILGLYFNYLDRVGLGFLPFTIITIENGTKLFRNQKLHFVYLIGVTISCILYFLISTQSNQYSYVFFFE